jgi:DNA-binding LacI/PurR family transcriptional regulator
LLLGVSNDIIANEAASIEKFKENRVEGVIVVPSVQVKYDLEHLYDLKSSGIPFVFSTTSYLGINADCVMCDLKKGSYLLTRHLLERGHKKIYLFSGSRTLLFSSHRIEGYKAAFEERGVDRSEEWIKEIFPNYDSAYAMAETLLKSVRPDAIITVNDVMAMGVLKCLKDNGIKVPGDISVAGYDDLLYTSILETPLTTVRQPIIEIARKSVDVLLEKIEQQVETFETYYIDPVLKIRETTK